MFGSVVFVLYFILRVIYKKDVIVEVEFFRNSFGKLIVVWILGFFFIIRVYFVLDLYSLF